MGEEQCDKEREREREGARARPRETAETRRMKSRKRSRSTNQVEETTISLSLCLYFFTNGQIHARTQPLLWSRALHLRQARMGPFADTLVFTSAFEQRASISVFSSFRPRELGGRHALASPVVLTPWPACSLAPWLALSRARALSLSLTLFPSFSLSLARALSPGQSCAPRRRWRCGIQ